MEDITAPDIQSLTLSSSQINLSEENSIKATIRLTDLGSGIGNNQLLSAAVRWRSPSGKQFVDASFYERSSGNNNDSIFIEDIDFNQYAEEGEWKIEYASLTDNAGNHKWLYPEELDSLSLDRPITVFRSGNSTTSSESSTIITEKSTPDNSTPTNSLESSTDKESSTAEREETSTRSARIESVKTAIDEIERFKITNHTTERLPNPFSFNVEINISNSEYLDSGYIAWGRKSDATCDPNQPQKTSNPIYLSFTNQSPSSGLKTFRGSIDLFSGGGEWELKEAYLVGTDGSRQTIGKQELKDIGVEHTFKAGIFGKLRDKINTIENSGNASLIRKKPFCELTNDIIYGYDWSMSHGTDIVSAIYKSKEIPLWWDWYRVTQVYTGHGFQIRQAEYSEEFNELITVSTVVGDGEEYGKVNGTLPNPDFTHYTIVRHSVEDGSRTSTWDFAGRKWVHSDEFPTYFKVIHPKKNANFDLVPTQIRGTVERMWNEATEDFPDFFDKTTGLKRNISLGSNSPSASSSDEAKNMEEAQDNDEITITAPKKFKVKAIDKITNFNPSTDTLEIDTDSFSIGSSATFASGKNKKEVRKKLAKQDFDFLYDEKKGGLYFNENGSDKGLGDGGIIAILKGAPDLAAGNFEFI